MGSPDLTCVQEQRSIKKWQPGSSYGACSSTWQWHSQRSCMQKTKYQRKKQRQVLPSRDRPDRKNFLACSKSSSSRTAIVLPATETEAFASQRRSAVARAALLLDPVLQALESAVFSHSRLVAALSRRTTRTSPLRTTQQQPQLGCACTI